MTPDSSLNSIERWPDVFAHLEAAVTPQSKHRGRQLEKQGEVLSIDPREDHVTGLVWGTHQYSVSIAWETAGEAPALTCNCAAFDNLGPCKHIWALALAFQRRVKESPSGGIGALGTAETEAEKAHADSLRSRMSDAWRERLLNLQQCTPEQSHDPWKALVLGREEIVYIVAPVEGFNWTQCVIEACTRRQRRSGTWGKPKPLDLNTWRLAHAVRAEDRPLLSTLALAHDSDEVGYKHWKTRSQTTVRNDGCIDLLRRMVQTGRLHTKGPRGGLQRSLQDQFDQPWRLQLTLLEEPADQLEGVGTANESVSTLNGELVRGEERLSLEEARWITAEGLMLHESALSLIEPAGAGAIALELRGGGAISLPSPARLDLLDTLEERCPGILAEKLAQELEAPEAERVSLTPVLYVQGPSAESSGEDFEEDVDEATESERGSQELDCRLAFRYDELEVDFGDRRTRMLNPKSGAYLRRDTAAEKEAVIRFLSSGGRRRNIDPELGRDATIKARDLAGLAETLMDEGWQVEAEGMPLVRANGFQLAVKTNIDWFELEGGMSFGQEIVPFPELLRAARKGRRIVRLSDGSRGMLPEDWLERWRLLGLAKAEGDNMRFGLSQAWLLADLLQGQEAQVDAGFKRLREKLDSSLNAKPVTEGPNFNGELRLYQREGLGWMRLLNEIGLGGCLADDMGLGKTVQFLAFLLSRMDDRDGLPSLVVAPRSLTFNWIAEAQRFTPDLRVFDYTGPDRIERLAAADDPHLIVTTYGTLRRDALELSKKQFDVIALDEAQAIKNRDSQTARCARILRARQRLALTGTPIENHLGELWSIFDFLNPGMLGSAGVFQRLGVGRNDTTLDDENRETMLRAMKPFILRRTKSEVLKDLPEKIEQTISCELTGEQAADYAQLRDHFRQSFGGTALGGEKKAKGKGGMGMEVLTALLRLRQCACHPGLIDPERVGEESAKLDTIVPLLEELADEGHKALIFSQFTSFLAILRTKLEERNLPYTYLDGKTRKRQECVDAFQNDPDIPFFLISLKAGGSGLNLTAADYVFILDPWWNPAVESQAVDRAHRIGQERTVNVYRVLARNTIEERIMELQEKKRGLAEAVLGGAASTLRDLQPEDLEFLLS